MQRVAVVDLGMGNLRSVQRALERAAEGAGVPCRVEITGAPGAIAESDRIVVPGQGAFRDCAAALATGTGDALREVIARGRPYLGICLGLQALFDGSDEAPGARGLGIFSGRSVRLEGGPGVKVPHMGWNEIASTRGFAGPLTVFDAASPFVYFVHSYHAVPEDPALVAATAQHGENRITAAIQRDNVTATQFHPEKSQEAGLRFLAAFLRD
jgi:glutamine amidotransferase